MGKKRGRTGESDKIGYTKRTNPENNEDDSDDESVVNVDFQFLDPSEDHYQGIRTILGQRIAIPVNQPRQPSLGALTSAIVEQPNIGSVLTNDELDVFGVFSLLNLRQYEGLDGLIDTVSSVAAKSANKTVQENFAAILRDPTNNVGLLVKERPVNLPPILAANGLSMLIEDIEWSIEECEDEEEKKYYWFSHVLIFSRVFSEDVAEGEESAAAPSPSKKGKNTGVNSEAQFLCPMFEDDVILKSCDPDFRILTPPFDHLAAPTPFYNQEMEEETSHEETVAISLISFKQFLSVLKELPSIAK